MAGVPLIVIGGALFIWAVRTFREAGTSVSPDEPARALVVSGPYGFSRNPICLGFTLIYIGVTCAFNALLPIVLLPLALLIIQRGVVKREERYLEEKFGEGYLRYEARVRRWL